MAALRAVVVLSALVALTALSSVDAQAAPKVCTAADVGKGFCLDCKTRARCVTAGSPPVASSGCTTAGEACTVIAGIAVCRPEAETACACNKASQCDPYNKDAQYVCLNGGVRVVSLCKSGQTCSAGSCVTPPVEPTTPSPDDICKSSDDGFALVKPQCSSALYCSAGASLGITYCSTGEYFDAIEQICVPAPPVPCRGCGLGACPDKTDCSKFLVCDNGLVLDEEVCSEPTPEFDIYTNECVAAGSGTCTPNDGCDLPISSSSTTSSFSSTTTLETSSGTNAWCSDSPPQLCQCHC